MSVISRKQARAEGLKRYFTGKPCPHGHLTQRLVSDRSCTACTKVKNNSTANKARRAAHFKEYVKNNRDKFREYDNKRRHARKEYQQEYMAAYYKEKRHEFIARVRLRQVALIKRTPAWADLDHIRDFYELARIATEHTGFAFHVDHQVPVQGERVSGLHVPQNLSVLLAEHNLSKRNKFDIEGASL